MGSGRTRRLSLHALPACSPHTLPARPRACEVPCPPACTPLTRAQTIQYILPHENAKLAQAELLVIDEAAAIPLPTVRASAAARDGARAGMAAWP